MPALSDRMTVLEVMVEMMVTHNMAMEADQDQALNDYREVAIMALSRRRTEDEMDDVVSILDERVVKVQEHLTVIRQMMNQEREGTRH